MARSITRRSLLAGAAAFTLATPAVAKWQVPEEKMWIHVNNVDHDATSWLEQARKKKMRLAEIGERINGASGKSIPLMKKQITMVCFAYNYTSANVGAWHQPLGKSLQKATLPARNPHECVSTMGVPVLNLPSGKLLQPSVAWIFQTAGEIATLEFDHRQMTRNPKPENGGTYFIFCGSAEAGNPTPVYPSATEGAHITSSLVAHEMGTNNRGVLPLTWRT